MATPQQVTDAIRVLDQVIGERQLELKKQIAKRETFDPNHERECHQLGELERAWDLISHIAMDAYPGGV